MLFLIGLPDEAKLDDARKVPTEKVAGDKAE